MVAVKNAAIYDGRKIASAKKAGIMQFATAAQAVALSRSDRALSPSLLSSALAQIGPSQLIAEGFQLYADVTLTSAQVKALETTQIELVAAPGAGNVLAFKGALLKLDYGGTNAFTESGDNLGIKYTDDSGVQVCTTIEMTGFIDATADTYTNAVPSADAIVAAAGAENQALVLDNLGSAIAGNAANDNALVVRCFYQIVSI